MSYPSCTTPSTSCTDCTAEMRSGNEARAVGRAPPFARRAWPVVTTTRATVARMAVVSLPAQDWIDDVGPIPGVEFVAWDMSGEPPLGSEVRVVVPPYMGASARIPALRHTPRVELVHLLSAGYDDVLRRLPPGVRLANAAGVHDASTAELAVALALAALRDFPDFIVAQREGRWIPLDFHRPGRPAGPPAGLRRHRPALSRRGSRRSRCGSPLSPATRRRPPRAERARRRRLPALLPDHDVVIVVVPLTPETTGLVDAAFLAALPTVQSSSTSPAVRSSTQWRCCARRRLAASAPHSTSPTPSHCRPATGLVQPGRPHHPPRGWRDVGLPPARCGCCGTRSARMPRGARCATSSWPTRREGRHPGCAEAVRSGPVLSCLVRSRPGASRLSGRRCADEPSGTPTPTPRVPCTTPCHTPQARVRDTQNAGVGVAHRCHAGGMTRTIVGIGTRKGLWLAEH